MLTSFDSHGASAAIRARGVSQCLVWLWHSLTRRASVYSLQSKAFTAMKNTSASCFVGRNVHLYWFSGSGNTLLAAISLANELRSCGVEVELRSLEKSDPTMIDPDAIFAVAFPTHCFTLPEFVRDFALRLPRVDGTPAFMLTTVGLCSGGVHGPLKAILTQKGFHCIGARQLLMPDSFFAFIHGTMAQRMIRSAQKRAAAYAHRLVDGKTSWRRVPVVSDLYAAFFRWFFRGRNMTRSCRYPVVYAREKSCIRCHRCVQMCPVEALVSIGNEPPKPELHCTLCLRCVAVCPVNAMRLCLMGLPPYRPKHDNELTSLFKNIFSKSD